MVPWRHSGLQRSTDEPWGDMYTTFPDKNDTAMENVSWRKQKEFNEPSSPTIWDLSLGRISIPVSGKKKTVKMDIFEHKHKAEGHTHLQIHLALGY